MVNRWQMVNLNYNTLTGIISADTSDLLTETQNEFKTALGADLDITAETPQGRLIEVETALKEAVINQNITIANMFNPNYASGTFLDAICGMTQCVRKSAASSIVEATLTGVSGTVIAAGSRATDVNGKAWALENETEIPSSGTVDALFVCTETGAIGCALETLTSITDGVLGWETITNNYTPTLGYDTESDLSLNKRRLKTLYVGTSTIENIESACWNVDNVLSVLAKENKTGATITYNGIDLVEHSVYVCVYGGTDSDVANAIYLNKSAGCDYNGNTNVDVTDSISGVVDTVTFQRPDVVQIQCQVTVKVLAATTDIAAAIKTAIADYQTGSVANVDGLSIGKNVSPFEIASAISIEVAEIHISSVKICVYGGTLSTNEVAINADEIARIPSSLITVVIT